MSEEIERIRAEVAERVSPKAKDRAEIERVLRKVSSKINREAKNRKLQVRVEVEGSIAKDTWVADDRDLDVFIIFPHGTSKEDMKEEGLKLAKAGAGGLWRLGYAEHPYVEVEIDGCRLDIVPSIEIRDGDRPVTSVDRTPLHTRFMLERLSPKMKRDVRVLKQFMKGIEVYGAELKVGGFSGYLCELLALNYGSFEKVIRAAAEWRGKTVIDYMHHYKEGEGGKVFDTPLVIVDPVDRRRNAAAAVTHQSYSTFIAASRWFLRRPAMDFFFPKPESAGFPEVSKAIRERGTAVAAIAVGCPNLPSDILWGEVYKSLTRTVDMLDEHSFRVNSHTAWSDEKGSVVLLIEVEGRGVREGRIHMGPKVSFADEAERFVNKYLDSKNVLAGPYVKEDRWYVELKRDQTDLKALIKEEFPKLRLSKDIMVEAKKGFKVFVDGELATLCRGRKELVEVLLKFVRKRPAWLR
ncbi:MAG: CCA tRNA nucleotidyltransferase [Candidatus Verstraetearchaeota archaeon]|nr:CCA tRNA nucleotidyltransferase [Candidatus Verstraetearchaeota archaeon]